jgi:hypothetical protein
MRKTAIAAALLAGQAGAVHHHMKVRRDAWW